MKYEVAIITVIKDSLDEACLSSLAAFLSSTDLKVVFVAVDNDSKTFSAHSLIKEKITEAIVILRERNYGFGHSCNRGAEEVEADYYLFLNPDTAITDYDFLGRLIAFLKACPAAGIAAPRLRYPDGRIQETCRRFPRWYAPIAQRTSLLSLSRQGRHRREFLMEDFDHYRYRLVDWVQGSAFMIDGALFRELGGFDRRFFMYYEDVDLCRRCWEKGRPVYYVPEAEIRHRYRKESADGRGIFSSLLKNRMTRAHISSWLKYSLKWWGKKI
jgi:GT2 family glycosyltransferase